MINEERSLIQKSPAISSDVFVEQVSFAGLVRLVRNMANQEQMMSLLRLTVVISRRVGSEFL